MRQADRALQRAIAQLDRAKQRGRRDEIRNAALAIGRAKQAVARDNARELEKQAAAARNAAARAERLANPQTPAERRSAAAAKGWETRRANALARQRGEVKAATPKRRASALRVFAVDDDGQIWPTRREQMTVAEQRAYLSIVSAFSAGETVFGSYTVAGPDEEPRYWIGCVVWIDEAGMTQYRFTPRGLSESEVLDKGKGQGQVCVVIPLL
jgi:small-conductance mechanosensitive channel